MSPTSEWPNGVVSGVWDDVPPRTYTAYDEKGVQISTRPYTASENAVADVRVLAETTAANEASIKANLESDVAWLQQKIGLSNSALTAEFNNNPAAFLKPLMRAVRRSAMVNLDKYDTSE